MTKEKRNWLIVLGIFALPFLIFLGCLISGLTSPTAPNQSLPNPNGYDDFVQAGKMVASDTGNFDEMNLNDLADLISSNSPALAIAREGFSKKCRALISINTTNFIALRMLGQAFVAEGKLAEQQGQITNALNSYLDTIRLGVDSAQGGNLIEGMIGVVIESLGTSHLQNITNQMTAKMCADAAHSLEILDTQRPTWNEMWAQEKNWSHQNYGLRGELLDIYYDLFSPNSKKNITRAQNVFKNHQNETRQLIIALAARAYELDKGKSPTNISNLVPNYLKAIPQNPFTGTNMNLPLK